MCRKKGVAKEKEGEEEKKCISNVSRYRTL